MLKKTLFGCLLMISLFAGCKDDSVDPEPEAFGYDYYPLEVGDFRIYSVTDIKFQFNKGDTTRFQVRERVDTTFTDQTNTLSYKIIRSVRPNENSAWKDDSVMVVTKSATNVLLTKDNTKYVKMVFPVKDGAEWIGDAFNTRVSPLWAMKVRDGKDIYKYEKAGEPFEINGETYPNTIKVLQSLPVDNGINLNDRHEVYAKGVGLVYRRFIRIDHSPCNDEDCEFGEDYKLQGHERHEVLTSYGTTK